MTFTGFPDAALEFYEGLEADNTKAYWTDHKAGYDECVLAPMKALLAELEPTFGEAKLFRPYRDVRFSKDKTPYKTHQGAWLTESSRYVQVSAEGLFVAAGYWETSKGQVDRLRQAIADDAAGAALERALAATAAYELGGQVLVRVPAGYDKDHPRAQLLRHKTLTVSREVGCPAWLSTKKATSQITKLLGEMTPVVDWLDTHVGRA